MSWRNNSDETFVNLPSGQNTVEVVATDLGANGGNVTTNHYSLNVTAGASKTFTYDENGNCSGYTSSTAPPTTYQFDAEDRLVSVDCSPYRSEFSYDGFGRRVKIVEKFLGNVTSTRQYVWCGTQLCEERDENNVVTKRFFAEGEQISGAKYFYTRDHLGSIRELTDETGAIRARYDYDPYGRRTKVQGDMDADFGFTGHYVHARSGLHLALYRAYDADIGRWINRDPIGEEGGLNLYDYVFGNPINSIDALGLWEINWPAIIRSSWTAAGTVVGAGVGFIAGGGGGAIAGLGVGDAVTIPAGAIAGAGVGAGAGGAVGSQIGDAIVKGLGLDCNNMGKGKDGDHQGHGPGGNDPIGQVARQYGIDPHEFGDYVEDSKFIDGMSNDTNYTWQELHQLAQNYLGDLEPGLSE